MTPESSASAEYGQHEIIHKLPDAKIVDRIDWLVERCTNKRVIHVGFANTGFRTAQDRAGQWLHARLSAVTSELVGVDNDTTGIAAATAEGFEVYQADCTDAQAVGALGIEPADIVLAGEVIEHISAPGAFLASLHHLCKPDGVLIVTTPNAYGLVNVAASVFRRVEINHPDHVVMFTWRTLTELMHRSGWEPSETLTYVPSVREHATASRLELAALRLVIACERLLGKLNRPFSADGLIVTAKAPLADKLPPAS